MREVVIFKDREAETETAGRDETVEIFKEKVERERQW